MTELVMGCPHCAKALVRVVWNHAGQFRWEHPSEDGDEECFHFGLRIGGDQVERLAAWNRRSIKPLYWEDHSKLNADDEEDIELIDLRASTSMGVYWISYDHFHKLSIQLSAPTEPSLMNFGSVADAKAKADELHEAAVRGALNG